MSSGDSATSLVHEARELAAGRHSGQRRKATGMPYFDHAEQVAGLLSDSGFDDEVVAAALLHDVVEHGGVEPADIRSRFGERVLGMVEAMTDRDEIEDWSERKDEHRGRVAAAGRDACAIYGADKLCGIREAQAGFAAHGPGVEDRLGNPLDLRLAVWADDLEMLEGLQPPLPFRDELEWAIATLAEETATAPRP